MEKEVEKDVDFQEEKEEDVKIKVVSPTFYSDAENYWKVVFYTHSCYSRIIHKSCSN